MQGCIRHYEELIHGQPKEWLKKNFRQGATDCFVNVAHLVRNIVWQTRERIAKRISLIGRGTYFCPKCQK